MLFSMVTVAFADGVNGPMQKAKIKVGISADFPPFEYYNENGELYGFDVDLMNYIGERIGFEIEFVNMSFDQLFSAVMGGEVACAISAIAITEERKNVIDYTVPYLSAKVTYSDGETSDTSIEQYAIVFPNNSAEKSKVLEAAGEIAIYSLVNDALITLIEDKTVEKLGEKYNLNKAADTDDFDYEYTVVSVPTDLPNDENDTSDGTAMSDGTPLAPPSDWAVSDVKKAEALNITEKGKLYRYRMSITREEFCELIYNYCYNVIKEVDTVTVENKFTDTTNSKIIRLNAMGIINGKSETEFAPNDLLTREEAAVILNRMVNKTVPVPVTEMYFAFDDEASISAWASDSIQIMCNMGVMNGVGDNKFAPQENYTTEQAIVTLVRVYANSGVSKSDNALISDDILFADKVNAQMPTDKNYMFSPMSIKMALALAANGASGETQQQILNALGLTSLDEFNSLSKDLIARYSQTDILKLNIANSIWMNKDKTSQNFSETFKKTATDFYDAEVKSINNSNAVKEINSWVSDKTNGKIPTIIQNADDFWAMLINAIYFKGAWQDEFSVNATKPDQFNNADGTKITVDFMNKTKWFPYAETKSVKMIELPYQNRVQNFSEDGEYLDTDVYKDLDVSMYLIMPEGDINVEQELSAAINDNAFKSTYIKMAMPKFKIEYSTDLNEIFMNMSITTAFDDKTADFTKMFDKGNMWFTKTIHKTFIDVDEKGTEAAAVTAIGMAGSALPPEPIELKFNKPFYFAIRDNTSGETLFMGRFAYAE